MYRPGRWWLLLHGTPLMPQAWDGVAGHPRRYGPVWAAPAPGRAGPGGHPQAALPGHWCSKGLIAPFPRMRWQRHGGTGTATRATRHGAGEVRPPGAAAAGGSVPVVLIAEMLLLVAIDDKGRVPIRRKASFHARNAFMKVGLAGALLAELAIDGQLMIARGGTVQAGDTRPGDELLADVYDAVRNHLRGRQPRGDIGGSWNRVVDRLVAAGVLGRDRPSALRPTSHPVIDAAVHRAVLDQVRT